MNESYSDITDKLGTPQWYDEHAVPRYCAFAPNRCANIYAKQAALVEIACQNCGQRFLVAFTWWEGARLWGGKDMPDLAQQIRDGVIHYGDPPNAGCCAAGPTMNCEDLRVVEFWKRGLEPEHEERAGPDGAIPLTPDVWDALTEWRRVPALEITLPDGEAMNRVVDIYRNGDDHGNS